MILDKIYNEETSLLERYRCSARSSRFVREKFGVTFALGAKKGYEWRNRGKILEYVHFSYVCGNTGPIPYMTNQQVDASNLCDIIRLGF